MSLTTPIRYVVKHWQLLAMQDGFTLYSTVIEAQPVPGGFMPVFIGKHGLRVVVQLAQPMPSVTDAQNALRNVLWAAHIAGRISLLEHPTIKERAA